MNVTGTSWTPNSDLPIGNYRVWVRGIDASGRWGQWSTMATFRVASAPTVTGPLVPTFDRTPTFEWNSVAGGQSDSLTVRNVNTGVVVHNITGLTTTNWTPGTDLVDGSYRWQVVAYGIGGLAGSWSAGVEIYVGGRPTFTNTPSGTLPTLTWTNVVGAVRYELQINRIDVPLANVVRNSGLTSNSFTATTPLVVGRTYRAWIRAISITGEVSVWSKAVTFTVARIDEPHLRDQFGDLVPQVHLAVLATGENREEKSPSSVMVAASTARTSSQAPEPTHHAPTHSIEPTMSQPDPASDQPSLSSTSQTRLWRFHSEPTPCQSFLLQGGSRPPCERAVVIQ